MNEQDQIDQDIWNGEYDHFENFEEIVAMHKAGALEN